MYVKVCEMYVNDSTRSSYRYSNIYIYIDDGNHTILQTNRKFLPPVPPPVPRTEPTNRK